MKTKFEKLQALGNDYIFIDCIRQRLGKINLPSLSKRICDRNFGVGSDGLILIERGKKTKFGMRMFNPDGSEAELCGNGVRCFAMYVFESELSKKKTQKIETKKGMVETEILCSSHEGFWVRVDMGEPVLESRKIPVKSKNRFFIQEKIKVGKKQTVVTCVNIGNPHTVIIVKNFPRDWKEIGSRIENSKIFPHRTNVEFVRVKGRRKIELRVWERGAGVTLSSATGGCAALVACALNGKTDTEAEVLFEKGALKIFWDKVKNHIFVEGPSEWVFSGIYDFQRNPHESYY